MLMGKEKLIPFLAIVIIILGTLSTLYVNANTISIDDDIITVNNKEYTIEQLLKMTNTKTITTNEGEKSGISLESIIEISGVPCPSCNKYNIVGSDKYSKIVDWNTLKTGVITEEKRVYFPETAHAFWVRDVAEIEVK
jgi:hypothetical protein